MVNFYIRINSESEDGIKCCKVDIFCTILIYHNVSKDNYLIDLPVLL